MRSPSPKVTEGSPDRRGACYDGQGVNFALFSAHATKVELCLFSDDGKTELARIALPKKTGDVWHGHVEGLKPGQVYGYRVHGPDAPEEGHFFNPNKLLLDPYARELVGEIRWTEAHRDPAKDNADVMVKARVVEPLTKTQPVHPRTAWQDTIVYEAHMKGFTKTDPNVREELRGTAAGFASPPVIDYLKALGITAVEFLPLMAKVQDERLEKFGLKNYWGYNTLGFFAPERDYLKTGGREELRDMVDALHMAGIEVIMDVVFNHTAEGGPGEPTLSFRGIDNASYYKLDPKDKSRYRDETGCGNTLNIAHPEVRRMVLDSLRYWAEEFGVDGFRFDLASVMGRDPDAFDPEAQFFKDIAADPVLAGVKMIAEPWDVGMGGYQLGQFPPGWHEWNDRFRDDIRSFWRGDAGMVGKKATRLAGSSPEFGKRGRTPHDSINMVTCHDGFTLHDLVSYTDKNNHANGENNKDGHGHNFSHNHGAEGEASDPAVIGLRERQKRNMLASLFLAQGTPMLLAGDENGNSQKGNNNAYCQDNETGWLNWDKISAEGKKLTAFVKKLIAFRKDHPVLSHPEYLHGKNICEEGMRDLRWIAPSGRRKTQKDWHNADNRCVGMMLNGAAAGTRKKERLLAVFNSAAAPVDFILPKAGKGKIWHRVLDTSEPELDQPKAAGLVHAVPAKSVVVFVGK